MQDRPPGTKEAKLADLALVAWLCVTSAAWLAQFVKPGLALLARLVGGRQ